MAWRLRAALTTIGCVSAVFFILLCLEGRYVERLVSRASQELEVPSPLPQRRPGGREVRWTEEGVVKARERAETERQVVVTEGRQTWRERKDQLRKQAAERPSHRLPPLRKGFPTDPPRNNTAQFYSTVEPAMAAAVSRKRLQLRVSDEARELWWTMRGKVKQLQTEEQSGRAQKMAAVREMLREMSVHFHGVAIQVQDLGEILDGGPSKGAASELSLLLERRLEYLQNPPDCGTARQAVCKVSKPCGFACQMHHIAYCFIMAYATERTLVLEDRGWKYSPQGWDLVFQPISKCRAEQKYSPYAGLLNDSSRSIAFPYVEILTPRLPQLPMAIPRDIASQLASFHGYPFIWFIAQFLKYVMRPSPELKAFLEEKRIDLNFTHPIVGVHVRRTDKLKTEAAYHHITEYMREVEEWYAVKQLGTDVVRRVYLATDDPSVVEDARKSYPSYQFLSNPEGSSLASRTASRYSLQAVYGVVLDVLLLSQADYIVCTFSSQVCRLAYELMQSFHVDASQRYYSLDDIYYFGGQQGHDVRALQSHVAEAEGQLSFQKGDLISIAGNEKNGESVGTHRVTKMTGSFPSYKVAEETLVADFPTYPKVT